MKLSGAYRYQDSVSGAASLHIGVCCQVEAEEEAGIGRGGIAVGGRYTNAAAKTLQSLSCSHIYTTTNTTNTNTQAGAGTTALSLISSSASMRVHAHQATEEQKKNLVLFISAWPRGICRRHKFSFYSILNAVLQFGVLLLCIEG